ncbi:damage-inducible protein DinB [Alsobacter soli]|uniref:Damage-inducible protein DinB n=1 Tax=Alsobacter soli TaxID=2109933 RepID=A0A2T1HUF0_9HYPH|nr:DinB family protein [Alsobacter soli]PSC05285.1 damage-inducible protein DinB [Alsobacter soli]
MQRPYATLAGYNAWANRRLYDAVARLPDADYRADRGAFFKSLHGTLNHLLVADRIWMRRFTGEGESYKQLNLILFDSLADLRAAREAEDARILRYAQGLTDEALSGAIRYSRVSSPEVFEQPLAPALDHFFNHQAHHRGQAHAILTGLGAEAPELDLLFYHRESGEGAARKVEDATS